MEDSKGRYHFQLERRNKEVVRDQAKQINKSLKRLTKISHDAIEPTKARDDEPTQPFVTLPEPRKVDETLKDALEDAERACRLSAAPPTDLPKVKPKKWYKWAD